MRDGHWFAVYAAYLAAQAVLRVLIGPTLELDEAEALYFARDLAHGYNAQPPLYFWLQWGAFALLGPGIPALAAVKALLLFAFAVTVHRLLRLALPVGAAAAGVLALSLLPQIAWEAQRALTHSVLALTMSAVAALTLWQAIRGGGWRAHVAFGVAMGLGLLSKYNFALLPAGLLVAAVLDPELRGRLRPARLVAALGVAAVIAAGPAFWAFANPTVAGGSIDKLGIAATGWLAARGAGLVAFAMACAAFLTLGAVALGALRLAAGPATGPVPGVLRWLVRGTVAGAALLLAGVLAGGVTAVKDRWLLPLLWPLVPVMAALLWLRLAGRGRRVLGGVTAGLWILAAAALPWASLRDPGWRNGDFAPLLARIPDGATVVTDRTWIAGNLIHLGHRGPVLFNAAPPPGAIVVTEAAGPPDVTIPRGSRGLGVQLSVAP